MARQNFTAGQRAPLLPRPLSRLVASLSPSQACPDATAGEAERPPCRVSSGRSAACAAPWWQVDATLSGAAGTLDLRCPGRQRRASGGRGSNGDACSRTGGERRAGALPSLQPANVRLPTARNLRRHVAVRKLCLYCGMRGASPAEGTAARPRAPHAGAARLERDTRNKSRPGRGTAPEGARERAAAGWGVAAPPCPAGPRHAAACHLPLVMRRRFRR